MVEREYPKFLFAGFGSRFVAFIIDVFVISSISSIILVPMSNIFGIHKATAFFSIYNLINLIIYLGYFFLLTLLNEGQTLGKMIMGIKVVSLEDEDLKVETVFYREIIGRFILKKLKIFYFMILFNRDKQQLADFFAGTSVVNTEYFFEYMQLKQEAELVKKQMDNPDDKAVYTGEEVLVAREESNLENQLEKIEDENLEEIKEQE